MMNIEEPKHVFIKNGRTHSIYNESEFKTANTELTVVIDQDDNVRTLHTKDGSISLDHEAGRIFLEHEDVDRSAVAELSAEAFDILERIFTPTPEDTDDRTEVRKTVEGMDF